MEIELEAKERGKLANGQESNLLIGTAGEHLVCADLLSQGYRAFLADQICPYDVVVELPSARLIRIQVKTTRKATCCPQRGGSDYYIWTVRRAGKKGTRVYGQNEFDCLALVALDTKQIAYLPPSTRAQTVAIRSHNDSNPRAGISSRGGKSGRVFKDLTFPIIVPLFEGTV